MEDCGYKYVQNYQLLVSSFPNGHQRYNNYSERLIPQFLRKLNEILEKVIKHKQSHHHTVTMSQHCRRGIAKKDSRPNLTQSVDERIQSTASIPPPPSGRPVSSKYTAPQGSSGYRHPSALYHRPEQSPNQRRENEYEQDIIYEQEDRRKEPYRAQQGAHDIYCHISKDSSRPEVYYSIPATSEFLDATGYHILTRDQSASRIQREPDPEEGWTSHESEYTGSIAPSSSGFTDETSSSYRDHGRPANPEYEHVTRSIHQNTDLRERCRSSSPMRSYDRLYPYNHQKYPTTSSKDHPVSEFLSWIKITVTNNISWLSERSRT